MSEAEQKNMSVTLNVQTDSTATKTLQDMEKNNVKAVLDEKSKPQTSYMIVYIILAIIAILGLVWYFYFKG